jgi:hypothetical protein
MNIITVTTNTASGGDFTSLNANQTSEGWSFEINDSCGIEYTLPADILPELPDEAGLMKFIDSIRMDGEPTFKGLVFGFLEMNYPKGNDMTEVQLQEASNFLEIESNNSPKSQRNIKST